MNINQMKDSKYIRKEDVGDGITVTIKTVTQDNLAQEGQPEEIKYILNFREDVKPLVMNWTNIQLCAKACGSEETNDWAGKKIELYTDENVSYAGKLIGGVRIRKVGKRAVQSQVEDDDAPF